MPSNHVAATVIQAKLRQSSPGDQFEREADRVADAVMQMPEPSRFPERCETRGVLQAKADDSGGMVVSPSVERQIGNLRGRGQPMPEATRAHFEPRFGYDFGGVRVHYGSAAADVAQAVNARAFTVGSDVVFGAGEYAPGTAVGQQLLAHELAHVAQQQVSITLPVIQRQLDTRDGASNEDEVRILGERLWSQFPEGVTVAFYADPEPIEAKRRAVDWAKREHAIGPKGTEISAKELTFGQAISDTLELASTLTQLGEVLTDAVSKASMPEGTVPQTGIGPTKIRNIALFSHGGSTWCGIFGISADQVADKIKSIAPSLSANVNIILYACNTGRGQEEPEQWKEGTMEGGGADSVSGAMRDALLEEGISDATVWGHTTSGHVSTNFALRQFSAASGTNSPGLSYASAFIFGEIERIQALTDLQQAIETKGYTLDNLESFGKAANEKLSWSMYRCYADANAKLEYQGVNLGEAAPIHPDEVASVIKNHWIATYWPERISRIADQLVRQLKLKPTSSDK